jgi:hypothetical protein
MGGTDLFALFLGLIMFFVITCALLGTYKRKIAA